MSMTVEEAAMPWKETCPIYEKVRFIAACSEEPNLAEVCRRFGISRKTGYKWLARYEALGIDGLKERPPLALEPPFDRMKARLRSMEPPFDG
ncbi:MAG: helix-turn-helix domain-containing protein [Deltaproteobacteria bacterium]|nr:helix-turn-helix domain-containing protein [Deltaproteobacteria bacterium]